MSRDEDCDRDRRRESRTRGAGMRARMRPGYQLSVIDLSVNGALVEAARPLRPGSHVDVQLETDARGAVVSARVTRCVVSAIHAERGITYRAALSFIDTCDWVREARTPEGYPVLDQVSSAPAREAGDGHALPAPGVERQTLSAKSRK